MLLLVLAGLVLLGSSLASTWLLSLEQLSGRAVALGLIVAAQMQLAVLVAGALLGALRPLPLLGVQLAISLAVVGLAVVHAGADRPTLRASPFRWPEPGTRALPSGAFALEPEAGPAATEVEVRPMPGSHSPPMPSTDRGRSPEERSDERPGIVAAVREHPLHVATFVLVTLLHLWHVSLAASLPLVDYDGLALHGAAVAHWVTSQGFGASGLSPMVDAAPLGPAAISAWTATFRGDLQWMFLTSFGFLAIGAAAVAQLARRFGASAWDAALGAAAFSALPVVALQATSAYADLAAAGCMVAAWAWGAELLHRRSLLRADADALHRRVDRRDLILLGVALGLAAAARPANLAGLGFVLALVLVLAVAQRRDRSTPAPAVGPLMQRAALVVVPLVVLGGSWYVRTALDHGNPVYPFTVGPLDGLGSVERLLVAPNRPDVLTEVGGRVAQTVTSWIADLSPSTYAVDQRLGGFGPIFPLLLLPASAVLLLSDRRSTVRAAFGLAVALLIVVPTPWWSRGTIFLPAVAAAALAAVLSTTAGRRRTALLTAALVLTLIGALCTVRLSVYPAGPSHARVGPAAALDLARSAERHDLGPYAGYRWLDEERPRAILAVLEGAAPSLRVPLYGPSLDRRVVVVPASEAADELAGSLEAAGARLLLVPTTAEALLADLERGRGPLEVVATGADAPAGMVVVERR